MLIKSMYILAYDRAVDQLLESEEAARRLGVKLPTLYAYVSRGLLTSQRAADGKRSLFDAEQIEALARRSRGGRQVETRLAPARGPPVERRSLSDAEQIEALARRSRGGRQVETRLATVTTAITQLRTE